MSPESKISALFHFIQSTSYTKTWFEFWQLLAARSDQIAPRWPSIKLCKQFLLTVIFPCSTGVGCLGMPKLKLTRQISALTTIWYHTWLLVCQSLLRAVYGLAGGSNSKRQRTTWAVRSADESEVKVSKIKETVRLFSPCNMKLVELFVSSFKIEQTRKK